MLPQNQGQSDPLHKTFRAADGLQTQGRIGEFLYKDKRNLFYISLIHSQGHAARARRTGREGQGKEREALEEAGIGCKILGFGKIDPKLLSSDMDHDIKVVKSIHNTLFNLSSFPQDPPKPSVLSV